MVKGTAVQRILHPILQTSTPFTLLYVLIAGVERSDLLYPCQREAASIVAQRNISGMQWPQNDHYARIFPCLGLC